MVEIIKKKIIYKKVNNAIYLVWK